MRIVPPKTVVVERSVQHGRLVANLRRTLPEARFQVVDRVPESKVRDAKVLEVVEFHGRFLRACPGTRHYQCCGYQILHFGSQCSIDCSYCILQAYFNHANVRLFGNWEDLFAELDRQLNRYPGCLFRIGTGEFTDSLLLEPWTRFCVDLVPFFARRRNAILELKTKTDCIDTLEDLDHNGRVIVAWSLNAGPISRKEEPKAANIRRRIAAARRCADWGYWLAFHFDPMIDHKDWQRTYGEVLNELFSVVDPSRVVWISLGAFRFMPSLKPIIQKRHPGSALVYGEFIKGLDGKMRYFRDIRIEMYRFMADRLRRIDPQLCVYLCMEGNDVWRQTFGYAPDQKGGLHAMLDSAVKERMRVGRECVFSAKDCLT